MSFFCSLEELCDWRRRDRRVEVPRVKSVRAPVVQDVVNANENTTTRVMVRRLVSMCFADPNSYIFILSEDCRDTTFRARDTD